ncbi:MAG: hypothetical protein NZ700_10105 [Gemmataceae bacterium]|nr:hypothetical protein [Gemmataceae bacterium]MDW8264034.1 hypothetical protein [Gemmataceae bacterium]
MRWSMLICWGLVLSGAGSAWAGPEVTTAEVRAAVARALPLLRQGAEGHASQRSCFACHNQALPILALTTAQARGFALDSTFLDEQLLFIDAFLERNRGNFLKGRGVGGQVATAGYALLTLDWGGWRPNENTAAVAEYILNHRSESDHWPMQANRPPSESSGFTSTYLGLRALRVYGTAAQQERIAQRRQRAREWLLNAPVKDTEDRVFRLWGLKEAGADAAAVQAAAQDLAQQQRDDGGWAQLDTLASDAYATGSALVALHQAGGWKVEDPVYRRGLRFLLDQQRPDGSWHVVSRSRPFQVYFETGFPHGKDQFISIAASGWATTALALACPASP